MESHTVSTLLHVLGVGGVGVSNPLDNFGIVVGENPDCLLLSGTVVGENPDHVCWEHFQGSHLCNLRTWPDNRVMYF